MKTKLLIAVALIILTFGASCKKENSSTQSPALSPSALHSLHITTNANNELYLNGVQFWTDANNNKTFTAKGGDVVKAVYSGGFLNMFIDGSTTPTLSSTGSSGTLSYTFK